MDTTKKLQEFMSEEELKKSILKFHESQFKQLLRTLIYIFGAKALQELENTSELIITSSLSYYFEIKRELIYSCFINLIDYNLLSLYNNAFETHLCYQKIFGKFLHC